MEGPMESITEIEVVQALHDMKNEKVPGPSQVTSGMVKRAGIANIREQCILKTLKEVSSQFMVE